MDVWMNRQLKKRMFRLIQKKSNVSSM